MYRVYYHDKQGRTGPGTATIPQSFVDRLDLEVPAQIPADSTGEMMDNPYTSYTSYEGRKGNTYYEFVASNKSLGDYNEALPPLDSYRDSDDSDEGSQFLTLEDFLG